MVRECVIGLLAGMRSMMPLAALSLAAKPRQHAHAQQAHTPAARPASMKVRALAVALAAGELLGDKLRTAPDRIAPAGIGARVASGAWAAGLLASPRERYRAAALGAGVALAAAYLSFAVRQRAMRRYGQMRSGLIEDAVALGGALWVIRRSVRTTST